VNSVCAFLETGAVLMSIDSKACTRAIDESPLLSGPVLPRAIAKPDRAVAGHCKPSTFGGGVGTKLLCSQAT